ncbi:MAG TPA: MFS transporter [Vicinamibacterales bacterium]|nr:MFS transporter [Vicinamibacterales bacterium]
MTHRDSSAGASWLQRLVDVRPAELAGVGWSWMFFFAVLSAYYVIRPIRDDMGVAGGVNNLPWLFTGSLTGMLLANPPFAYLVARMPRQRFVSWGYRFFALNLLAFFALLRFGAAEQQIWIGRAFFIWTSIFNMFVVSIFWSVMADVFAPGQSKRLFGFIGAGGTIGGITGAALTGWLVAPLGAANLLLVSAVLLEGAALSARHLFNQPRTATDAEDGAAARAIPERPIGGTVWDGMRRAFADPYLLNVTLNMLFFTVLTTFLYFQQAAIVDAALVDSAARTRFFANVDLAVNSTELVTQMFLTGRIVQAVGMPIALALLPALSIPGFILLGITPTIPVLMVFQVARRSLNFSLARPAREMLFTVVPRGDRYKAKTFIDTVVYRAGDQIGAWAFLPLAAVGAGLGAVSAVAVVLALVSIVNAVWLGRKMQRRVAPDGQTAS